MAQPYLFLTELVGLTIYDLKRRKLGKIKDAAIVPVIDPVIQAELERILEVYDNDNCSAWDMQPDSTYKRRRPKEAEACRAAQELFIRILEEGDQN